MHPYFNTSKYRRIPTRNSGRKKKEKYFVRRYSLLYLFQRNQPPFRCFPEYTLVLSHTHARSRYTDIEGRSSRAIRVEERHKRKKRKRIKWRRRGVEVILTRFPTFGVGGFAEHAVEGVGRA